MAGCGKCPTRRKQSAALIWLYWNNGLMWRLHPERCTVSYLAMVDSGAASAFVLNRA